MTKITLATIKAFIRRNRDRLFIKNLSDFDAMTDGIQENNQPVFRIAAKCDKNKNNNGIERAWFVGQGRNYFEAWADEKKEGYKISNSCGSFILAVKKGTKQ